MQSHSKQANRGTGISRHDREPPLNLSILLYCDVWGVSGVTRCPLTALRLTVFILEFGIKLSVQEESDVILMCFFV